MQAKKPNEESALPAHEIAILKAQDETSTLLKSFLGHTCSTFHTSLTNGAFQKACSNIACALHEDETMRALMRSLLETMPLTSHEAIERYHSTMEEMLMPSLASAWEAEVQRSQLSCAAPSRKGQIRDVVEAIHRAYRQVLMEERRRMQELVHQRVLYVQSCADVTREMMASHELQGFAPHIHSLLSQKLNATPTQDVPRLAAEIERQAHAALKDETTFASMPECRVRQLLLAAVEREGVLWSEVDFLQKQVEALEAREQQQCEQNAKELNERVTEATAQLQQALSAAQAEICRLREENSMALEHQHAAEEATIKLDAYSVKLHTYLSLLARVLREQSVVTPELLQTEAFLSATARRTNVEESKSLVSPRPSLVLQSALRSDVSAMPALGVLDTQTSFLRQMAQTIDYKSMSAEATAMCVKAREEANQLRAQLIRERQRHTAEVRAAKGALSAELERSKRVIMAQRAVLEKETQNMTPSVSCKEEFVAFEEELNKKECRIKMLEAELCVARGHSAAVCPAPPECAQVATRMYIRTTHSDKSAAVEWEPPAIPYAHAPKRALARQLRAAHSVVVPKRPADPKRPSTGR